MTLYPTLSSSGFNELPKSIDQALTSPILSAPDGLMMMKIWKNVKVSTVMSFPTSESEEMNIIWKGQSGWNKKSNMKLWDDLEKEPKKQYLNCGDDLPEILSKNLQPDAPFFNLGRLHRLHCLCRFLPSLNSSPSLLRFTFWISVFRAAISFQGFDLHP